MSEEELIPELGDRVTILSQVFKSTTGRILYRDDTLIRVRPETRSTVAIDFPLDPDTGLFLDTLGVRELQIHEKRKQPAFAAQLAVFPNDQIQVYGKEGTVVDTLTVAAIVATLSQDALVIRTSTGLQVLDFGFRGTKDIVMVPIGNPEDAAEEESKAENALDAEPEPSAEEEEFFFSTAGLSSVEADDNKLWDDISQRESLFLSLIKALPFKKQKDPKQMARLYREVDILLALKNSIVVRDADQALVLGQTRSYVPHTLQDVAQQTTNPIASLLPVVNVRKTLYADEGAFGVQAEIDVKKDVDTLLEQLQAGSAYSNAVGTNAFAAYLRSLHSGATPYTAVLPEGPRISIDQDVIRSKLPSEKVRGYPATETPGYKAMIYGGKGGMVNLSSFEITDIHTRSARLLSGSILMDTKTGVPFVVADADTAVALAHVLLTRDLALHRSPTRSSVLLYDMLASETIRRPLSFFDQRLRYEWERQRVVNPNDAVVLADVIREQLKHNALRYMDYSIQSVLDGMGLRFLEWSPSLLKAVSLKDTQLAWIEAAAVAKEKADAAKKDASQPVYGSLFPESPLATVALPPVLADLVDEGQQDPLLITATLLQAAGCTALPLFIATAARTDAVPTLEASAVAESRRLAKREATQLEKNAAFRSKPKLNPCVHVDKIEQIRGVRDAKKRMDLLDDYIQKTAVGQHNQYILCGLCKLPLVCKHEKLLIEEQQHPGRSTILHKTLLLEYASPHVFEGRYICKFCGQTIQRIAYDTSLEFDDDGIPLSGRAVMADEPNDDADLALIVAAENTVTYTGQDKVLYLIARTVFEGAGFSASEDVFSRTLKSAKLYLEEKAPKEQAYTAQRQQLLTQAQASGKKVAVPPEYKKLICNLQIGVVGALCVLELQTAETQIPVPFPKATCPFSLAGFPLDGDDPAIGVGCIYYVGCVIASIYREDSPWGLTSWATQSDVGKRRDAVAGEIRNAMLKLLGLPKLPNIAQVTDLYRDRLTTKKEQRVGEGGAVIVLASKTDVLPPQFRPLPFLKAAVADQPIQNVTTFVHNVTEKSYTEMSPYVKEREFQLSHILVKEFHAAAGVGTVLHPLRSEGTCCVQSLQTVAKQGLGYKSLGVSEGLKKELDVIHRGALIVDSKNGASSAGGSHIRVPWSSPIDTTQMPVLEPDEFYKLFMKKCYQGRRYGRTHEFGSDSKCRNCGFVRPAQLTYLSLSEISDEKESVIARKLDAQAVLRKQICLQAFTDQAVAITEKTFLALEAAVKQHLAIIPIPKGPVPSDVEVLTALTATMYGVLDASMMADYERLLTGLNVIADKGYAKGIQRAKELAPFVSSRDGVFRQLEARMLELGAIAKDNDLLAALNVVVKSVRNQPLEPLGTPAKVSTLLRDLHAELSADAVEGAKLCAHFFVVLGEQALTHSYTIDGSANKLPLSKWFPSINRDHLDILRKIWVRDDQTVLPYTRYLNANYTTAMPMRNALLRIVQYLSPIFSLFTTTFKPSAHVLAEEWSTILEWFVGTAMLSLLMPNSPLYADVVSPDARISAPFFFLAFLQDVLEAGLHYALRFKRSPDEIAQVLRVREEVEKSIVMSRLKSDDKSLHDVEVIKKQLKLGVWGQGRLENLVGYNERIVGLQFSDIRSMGINDFGDHVVGPQAAQELADRAPREGYDNRAGQDEDE
jgi:hypothetical protein